MKKGFWIYLVAILVVFTACVDDNIGGKKSDGQIAFDIVEGDAIARSTGENSTSADTSKRSFSQDLLILNGDTVFFSFKEKSNTDLKMLKPRKQPKSRGAALDDEENPILTIFATAIVEDDNKTTYFQNAEVAINAEKIGETGYYWAEDNLSFFAHAVSKNNVTVSPTYSTNGAEFSGSFSYALPATQTGSAKDASNQPDVVFAISPDQAKQEFVPLQFHHALSAIVFEVGSMPEGVTLNSITISNVYSSGTCSMVSTSSADKPRDIAFTWTYPNGATQEASYTETLGEQEAVEGAQMGGKEAMFMMIPQSMGEETTFTLNFTLNDRPYSIEKTFADFISAWEADKKYIFRVGLPDGVEVEVTDVVNGRKKEDLKITNVGLSDAYIRAKIIGYWVIPDDVNKPEDQIEWYIVSGWKETDGIFDWGTTTSETETTHWRKHTDGYYYYMSVVERGMATGATATSPNGVPLFKSYELTATAPVANAQLELIIAAQAVIADKDVVDFAWPGNPITGSN